MQPGENPYQATDAEGDAQESGPRKQCRTCGQQISTAARKCPWCHELQGPHRTKAWAAGLVVPAVIIGVLAAGFSIYTWLESRPGQPGSQNYMDYISVDSSRVVEGKRDGQPAVWVVGTLTNNSPAEIQSIRVTAVLKNEAGEPITVLDLQDSRRIPPGGKWDFQIDGRHLTSFDEPVASHNVEVHWAWGTEK